MEALSSVPDAAKFRLEFKYDYLGRRTQKTVSTNNGMAYYVVAVSARDVLLVTGSNDPKEIEALKNFAVQVWSEASYRLTKKLFVYRQGKFELFRG